MQNSTENNKISLEKMNQAILEQTDYLLAPFLRLEKNKTHARKQGSLVLKLSSASSVPSISYPMFLPPLYAPFCESVQIMTKSVVIMLF